MKVICTLCPHHCALEEGKTGLCRARKNVQGTIISESYGKVTSIALDPIEKKPLNRFYPGGMILSVGSFGCNLRCPFCQNSDIATADSSIQTQHVSPETLVNKALELTPRGNIGIAYTYNEPLVGYEYVLDCARLARENNIKNVVVTNGMICEEPLLALLPYIDAMNIDLKAYTESFYKKLGGDLATVKNTIHLAAKACHVEVTTLIIPGENDSVAEMDALSSWLASIDSSIPLHISRFFPQWQMKDCAATPVKTVYALAEVARKHLEYVYEGNC
ncbi:MAG: AmmeMemoRadiSam system radical SAM enzyme [Clostridiales bacterium]|nr:AmmeMemoRadiSam system radical SAM enzyme [Clostridiales bacterium]